MFKTTPKHCIVCLAVLLAPLTAVAGGSEHAVPASPQTPHDAILMVASPGQQFQQPRPTASVLQDVERHVDAAQQEWATRRYRATGIEFAAALQNYRALMEMAGELTSADYAAARHGRWATQDLLFHQQRYTWNQIDTWMQELASQSRDLAARIRI